MTTIRSPPAGRLCASTEAPCAVPIDWAAVVPPTALAAAVAAALGTGAVAGVYPALRAARLSPAEALRSP